MKHLFSQFVAVLALALSVPAADQPPTLAIGSKAPDFTLPGVDDRNYSLKDFAASKVLAIVFTCNHCPSAQYYEGRIKQLTSDYRAKGVAVIAISPNDPKSVTPNELGYTDFGDSFPEMKLRAKDAGFNFPYLYAGDNEAVSRSYGPVATPHIFIFDAERKLRYQGRIDDSERIHSVKVSDARNVIDALLAGKEPAVTSTKVIGCSVKWAGKAETVQRYMDKLAAEPVTISKADAATMKALRKNESGKLRLVNVWATWCAPCVAEFDELVTINRMYRGRDFEFVAVAMNRPDEEKDVLKFLQKHQASNRNLIFGSDDRDPLINAFDPEWAGPVPYTLLISPEGKVVYKESGSVDTLALKRAIVKELNARKPW